MRAPDPVEASIHDDVSVERDRAAGGSFTEERDVAPGERQVTRVGAGAEEDDRVALGQRVVDLGQRHRRRDLDHLATEGVLHLGHHAGARVVGDGHLA